MSGHWPTLLELTPSSAPSEVALMAVLDLLERDYLAQLPRMRKGEDAALTRSSSTIVLGDQEVWIELAVAPSPPGTGGVRMTVRLDSKAYESAYDAIEQRMNPEGLDALIQFCVEVAAAAAAEGFRLRFDQGAPQVLTLDRLVQGLTSVEPEVGLVVGIAAASPRWPSVEPHWPDWARWAGYQVLVFIGATPT